MGKQSNYIWTIGYRDNGQPMIGGPFMDERDAQDGTDHLSNVRFVKLGTRDRSKAIPQLRAKALSQNTRPPPPDDGDQERRRGIMQRLLHRKSDTEDGELGE